VVAQGNALSAFDTGTGKMVAGTISLAAAPARIVVAPRDQAIVALNPATGTDGSLTIISDVAGFVGSPGSASPKTVAMPGQVARTAAFSPDGSKMYVLTGGMTVDPCAPGAMLTTNTIQIYGLDGTMQGQLALEGFAADLTVDPQSGTLVIADVAGKEVATIDPASGAPTKLLGNLTCPSAVRVVNGTVFAVTSDRDMTTNAFTLRRVPLKGGADASTLFSGPNYNIPIDSMPSSNGDIGMALLPVRPVSIDAYELAVTPDGSRLEFATRAVYNEAGTKFVFSGENCTANFNIVEYGLFAVDLRTGNAAYESRATLVTKGANGCVDCVIGSPFPDQVVACQSTAGDKPAGLAATFGQ
jgi:DNA-binding beta-propeller fold protein YncE